MPTWELTTVADDFATAFDGETLRRFDGLAPDTDHEFDGLAFRTLPRPPGELLSRVATVNDVHLGETICGHVDAGPLAGSEVYRSAPGEEPYPEVMNRAAIAEMVSVAPDAVVVKGDLTNDGLDVEFDAFLEAYGSAFGDRLHYIRGNHDAYRGQAIADVGPFTVDLPGVRLAAVDTTLPGAANGRFPAEQADWLDTAGAEADRPVLVFGHHHVWDPGSRTRPDNYFGIVPTDSERLIEVVARRAAFAGYFAGHTHRNRVRRFTATAGRPWAEVACVKDFPGAWAEYRVFEGGILQVVHRLAAPEALRWTERTRGMFAGTYAGYAFGTLADRCFPVTPVAER